jgi:hypothetical protein
LIQRPPHDRHSDRESEKCPPDLETLERDVDLQDIVTLNLSRAVQRNRWARSETMCRTRRSRQDDGRPGAPSVFKSKRRSGNSGHGENVLALSKSVRTIRQAGPVPT